MIQVIGTFANGFILFSKPDGERGRSIYIADQHAVHERIRLEMLMWHLGQDEKDRRERPFPLAITQLDKNLLDSGMVELDSLKGRACQGTGQDNVGLLIRPAAVGAIKITNQLTLPRAADLLEGLFSTCRLPYICAHGRPTLARLTME